MTATMPISLTLSEASYVVGRSSAVINKAVDRGVIRATLQRRGKSTLRRLGPAELRFLKLAGDLDKDFTPRGRRKLYEALRRLPTTSHRLALGPLELNLSDVDRQIQDRLRRLEEIRAAVDVGGGECDPVIRGTGVPVYVIAGLARGQTVEEILEDYPSLDREQVEGAVEYAKAYPKAGRPYPARSFKRMIGDLAQAGVWDVESDSDEARTPRLMP